MEPSAGTLRDDLLHAIGLVGEAIAELQTAMQFAAEGSAFERQVTDAHGRACDWLTRVQDLINVAPATRL